MAEGKKADLFHARILFFASPYFVARAIGFNRLSRNAVSMAPTLDGFATIPIGMQGTRIVYLSEPADIEPDLPRRFWGQMNQGKVKCRKLHSLDGLVLKSSRSFNSTKSVALMHIPSCKEPQKCRESWWWGCLAT